MLVIRLQRTGRKGHAMFRVVVQDGRQTPTSGKVVAWLGSYDPHAKTLIINKEKASFYLEHGAQPSDRTARLLKDDGVMLPDWVKVASKKQRAIRNADKRRSTRPPEPKEVENEAPVEEAPEVNEVEEPVDSSKETEVPATTVDADKSANTSEEETDALKS